MLYLGVVSIILEDGNEFSSVQVPKYVAIHFTDPHSAAPPPLRKSTPPPPHSPSCSSLSWLDAEKRGFLPISRKVLAISISHRISYCVSQSHSITLIFLHDPRIYPLVANKIQFLLPPPAHPTSHERTKGESLKDTH